MDTQLLNRLIDTRRTLHENPELGFNEFQTAALVRRHLDELAIPAETLAVTGVVAWMQKGTGPVVVLRADMDALPITEETGLPFRSRRAGLMHACGHDIHTTMLLGAAYLLKERDFNGTVKFVFQPSEEGNSNSPVKGKSGGQLMVEAGMLNGVSAAVALHVNPLLPVGTLEYRNGEYLSNVCNFSIRVIGKAGHAGSLEHVVDPVLISAQLIVAAQSIISHTAPAQPAVLAFTNTQISSEPTHNIIPESVLLQGSLRALNINVYNRIVERLKALLHGLETAFGCTIELAFSAYYPSLLNNAVVNEQLAAAQHRVFGKANIRAGAGLLVAEDFAFYSREVPSQFYFLGARKEGAGDYFLHHPQVIFDEACIPLGAQFLAEAAVDLLATYR